MGLSPLLRGLNDDVKELGVGGWELEFNLSTFHLSTFKPSRFARQNARSPYKYENRPQKKPIISLIKLLIFKRNPKKSAWKFFLSNVKQKIFSSEKSTS